MPRRNSPTTSSLWRYHLRRARSTPTTVDELHPASDAANASSTSRSAPASRQLAIRPTTSPESSRADARLTLNHRNAPVPDRSGASNRFSHPLIYIARRNLTSPSRNSVPEGGRVDPGPLHPLEHAAATAFAHLECGSDCQSEPVEFRAVGLGPSPDRPGRPAGKPRPGHSPARWFPTPPSRLS
jgi:hypothetical protein